MARYAATPDGIVQYTAEEEAVRDADVARFEDYLANHKYKDDRRIAYASLGDQLDLLFHDMTAGKGNKDGEWYKAVAKVKSDISKPG